MDSRIGEALIALVDLCGRPMGAENVINLARKTLPKLEKITLALDELEFIILENEKEIANKNAINI